jgi:hypothetical protein
MAFTGATNPLTGTDSTDTLTRDIHAGVLEALRRPTLIFNTIYKQTGTGGTGLRFIIEGKEDTDNTNVASYATSGTQINVTSGTQDELVINFDRPQYVARRVDGWDEAVTNWGVMDMQGRQIQSKLLNTIDRKAIAAVEAATTATGLVGNGDGTVVVNTVIASATTPTTKGNALAESIIAAIAAIRGNDDFGDLHIMVDPINYSYLLQSDKIVNTDYTSGNGGIDTGIVRTVGGATLIQTNNFPATAALEAIVYGMQAAGAAILWDVKTKILDDADFLDAKRIQSYFSNGMASLRCQSAAAIKSA